MAGLELAGCSSSRVEWAATGGASGLTREDLVPGRPEINNGKAVIALGRKQGTKAGRAQFVVVHASEDQTALALISAFAATTKPGQNLTNLNYNRFRGILDRVFKDLDLANLGYTPHSPRAGWATTWRLSGMPFIEIQEWGRWQNAATLRIYLDAVAASIVCFTERKRFSPLPLTWMIISPSGFHGGGNRTSTSWACSPLSQL